MQEISCRYYKIYHYLVLCKAKGYMIESHTTQFSKRCSKDILSTFSRWSPFDHVPIDHSATHSAWTVERYRLLWVAVVNRDCVQTGHSFLKTSLGELCSVDIFEYDIVRIL